MRIQFEVKEKLSEIIKEILHSDRWSSLIQEELNGTVKLLMVNENFSICYAVEIYHELEIILRMEKPRYTYYFYQIGDSVWCDYDGNYDDLLKQKCLPKITLKEEICRHKKTVKKKDVNIEDTLNVSETRSRGFWNENIKEYNNYNLKEPNYDQFIKEDIIVPTDNSTE